MSSLKSPLKNIFQRMFGRWDNSPQDQVFYVRVFFAVISALICTAGGQAFAGVRGLMFGLLVYVLTLFVIIYLLDVDPGSVGGRTKLITNALPSYLLLWVVLWTLFYAFVVPVGLL